MQASEQLASKGLFLMGGVNKARKNQVWGREVSDGGMMSQLISECFNLSSVYSQEGLLR